jgi:hypothetical protein
MMKVGPATDPESEMGPVIALPVEWLEPSP